MDSEYLAVEPIIKIMQKVQPYFPTISPSQYNYYKEPSMSPAKTIMQKLGKSWNDILSSCGLPAPLDRDTLSRLSNALHLLEKQIIRTLKLGWAEKSYIISKKKMRPDSSNVERMYLREHQLLVLDVKLCVCSSPITIYKYLPIFEHPPVPNQITFFPVWMAEDILGDEPGSPVDNEGQLKFFGVNNILYICYLIGKPQKNFLPGSEIACGRASFLKKKRIPLNMEIRFLEFRDLPALYSRIAGIENNGRDIAPIMGMAERIREVILGLSENAGETSREIYQAVKMKMGM